MELPVALIQKTLPIYAALKGKIGRTPGLYDGCGFDRFTFLLIHSHLAMNSVVQQNLTLPRSPSKPKIVLY